jgi:DNA-binding MarR family transcriptional regulator
MMDDMARLENLMGVHALALVDRMVAGQAPTERAALVTLLAHPGSGVGWLADVLGMTDSGGTRLVERLVADGLVARRPGTDARSRVLELTSQGRRRAREVLAAREHELARALAPLTEAERRTLERLLAKVVSGLTDDPSTALHVCRMCDREACGVTSGRCPLIHTSPARDVP